MLTLAFFGFMIGTVLFGIGFLALTFRHHYLEAQKKKSGEKEPPPSHLSS